MPATAARRRERPADGIAAPIHPADIEAVARGEPPATPFTLYAPRHDAPYLPEDPPDPWLDRPGLRALVIMLILLGLLAAWALIGDAPPGPRS